EMIETVHSATIAEVAMKSHRSLILTCAEGQLSSLRLTCAEGQLSSLRLTCAEGQLSFRWRKDDLPKRVALFHGEFSIQRERSRPWNWRDFDGRGPFSQCRAVGLELHGSHAGALAGERKACDPRINGHEHFLDSRSAWRTFWCRCSGTHCS